MEEFPNQPRLARRTGCAGRLAVMAGAFALGAGAMGGLAWHNGWRPVAMPFAHSPAPPAATPDLPAMAATQAQLAIRLAALDQKLAQTEARAAAAAGNAGRAEALLIAIATRRAIDRGSPLGYLEGQLHTRFGEALPNVVATVIAFARAPITQDRLVAQLDVLAPQLVGPEQQTTWSKVRHDLSGLFVLHSDSAPPAPSPQMRLDHARLCLKEGKIEDAIADVRLLPGAASAGPWLADAQRYAEAKHALDAIDTSALLEPKLLKDGAGKPIEQASPVAAKPSANKPPAK